MTLLLIRPQPATTEERLVRTARDQLSWGTTYDPAYVRLAYPGGDVPRDRGVCTDVVVRALRAVGHDLQVLIHEDKRKHPRAYPPALLDRNIDHRRVPNQVAFFRRRGRELPRKLEAASQWRAGDLVVWKLDNGRDHIGILTDRQGASGWPKVVHNLSKPAEDDCLGSWTITGHFRYPR